MKSPSSNKKFRFSSSQLLGSPDAETDTILLETFIHNECLDLLLNMENQSSIIIGRTGSGKSAILKYIEENNHKVRRIEPEAMSLKHLYNSDLLNHFRSLGINLNLFYKVLWKHVFVVELLNLYFLDNPQRKKTVFDAIKSRFDSEKKTFSKDKALIYLSTYSNDFWQATESRIREIEKKLESKLNTELGFNVKDLAKISAKDETGSSVTTKHEVVNKAETIINSYVANEIYDIINIMKQEFFIDYNKKYFIIIDDLDKEWIPGEIRYELIASMIEAIKELVPLKGSKIIIALRDNLQELVLAGHLHKGGQREKFKPLFISLLWSESSLKELVQKRLNKITNSNIKVDEIFNNSDKKDRFKYILERTFYRPRDVISYINHIIKKSDNKSYINTDIVKQAESSYSTDRLEALEDEWNENYGDIKSTFNCYVGIYDGFRLKSLKEDMFMEIYVPDNLNNYRGKLHEIISKWKANTFSFNTFIKELIMIHYKLGVIGIKKSPNYSTLFYYDENTISINDLNNDCRFYIHKAYYSALRINVKAQEFDKY